MSSSCKRGCPLNADVVRHYIEYDAASRTERSAEKICCHFHLSLINSFMRASLDNFTKLATVFPAYAVVHREFMADQDAFLKKYAL